MIWGNAIGIYLLLGTVLMGLGMVRRAGWIASGTLKETPAGKYGRPLFVIGVTLGVLLWPIFIFAIPIMWRLRGKVKGIERSIEFCEHSTAFEPICGPCSRELKRTSASAAAKAAKTRLVGTLRRLNDAEGRLREKMADYIKARPECPKCGKTGTLSQYLDSVWVKCASCGRRTYTPDPSVPEEVDMMPVRPVEGRIVGGRPVEGQMAGASYECSACGMAFEGFPPAANPKGLPLCMTCKLESLKKGEF